jgi:hypothetical protein
MHIYRQKSVIFLMGYLVIFLIVMLVCISNLNSNRTLFDIGMNPSLQNWMILIFSVLAIIKVVIEIAKIESHAEYDRKLKKLGGKFP